MALVEVDGGVLGWLIGAALLEMLYLNKFKEKRDKREHFIREEPLSFNIHSGPCLGLFW